MVLINDILVGDEIFTEQFVCDLDKCKGGCCVDGDCGAPLTDEEADSLSKAYPIIKDMLPLEHQKLIEKEGLFVVDPDFGKVTPTLDGGICAFGYYDEKGIVKCALEAKFREGESDVPKPVSCHLFPIRVVETETYTMLNYEPRPGLCDAACTLGRSLKMPVYRFLKEPIIRRFGQDFYDAIEATAKEYFQSE